MALAGEIADPGAYNRDTKKLVARAERTTSSTGTSGTTEKEVLQLESVPVKAGRAYWIGTPSLLCIALAGDVVGLRIRYTIDDSTATISSTVLEYTQTTIRAGTPDEPISIGRWHFPSSDQNLSLLLTCHRIAGTGSCVISGGTDRPIQLIVEDRGEDPGNTGISL